MIRSQYITQVDLISILGIDETIYPDDTNTKKLINEASEDIDYVTIKKSKRYNVNNAPDLLKLATAYQVEYRRQNPDIDDTYDISSGFNIGKYSEHGSNNTINQEFKRISPRSRKYLLEAGLFNRAII